MTDTCTCPPDDCHGGHTINVGPALTPAQFCGYGSCDRPPGHDGPHRCRCSKPVDSPANGCKWHTPGERLTDDRLRQLRDDPAVCTNAGERSMAAELLALRDERARRAKLYVELEAERDLWKERAEKGQLLRDDLIKELNQRRPRVAELEADSIDRDFGIQAMSIAPGESTLSTTPTTERARNLVLAMSLACGRMLDEDQAPNYVEFEVSPAGHPGYVVHVRRAEGRSPHTLRRDAEARAEKAEARVAELEAEAQADERAIEEARDERDAARDQAAEAETGQQELIGFAVVSTAGQDDYLCLASDLLHRQADTAHGELIMARAESPSTPWRVVELREVTE